MKNKPLAILMSVLVAFGLWLYVITVVSPESEKTYYEIPVVIQSKNILTERGLMIVSEEPKVTLELKSSRAILRELNEANINVITNVANIEKPGTYNLTYSISYPGNIPDNEITVQKSSTDQIAVTVENRITKDVPVVIDYNDTDVPEGYRADRQNQQLDFTEIEITGPESVTSQIEQAVVEVDLTDKTTALAGEYQYTLCDKLGKPVNAEKITVNTDKVNLLINIQREKELPVVYNPIYGNGATDSNCTITVNPAVIKVGGTDASLANVEALSLGDINLAEIIAGIKIPDDTGIPEDQVWTIAVADLLPKDVVNLSGVEEITIQVKFAALGTVTFDVPIETDRVTYINLPEDMRVKRLEKRSVSVTLLGSRDLINAVKQNMLKVELDVAGLEPGTAKTITPTRIIVPEEYASLGVKFEGNATVTLEKIP